MRLSKSLGLACIAITSAYSFIIKPVSQSALATHRIHRQEGAAGYRIMEGVDRGE